MLFRSYLYFSLLKSKNFPILYFLFTSLHTSLTGQGGFEGDAHAQLSTKPSFMLFSCFLAPCLCSPSSVNFFLSVKPSFTLFSCFFCPPFSVAFSPACKPSFAIFRCFRSSSLTISLVSSSSPSLCGISRVSIHIVKL